MCAEKEIGVPQGECSSCFIQQISLVIFFFTEYLLNTFTFMHLADAFIQSDLHCIQVTVLHLISSCFPWESNP